MITAYKACLPKKEWRQLRIKEHIDYLRDRGFIIEASKEFVYIHNSGNVEVVSDVTIQIHMDALRAEKPRDVLNYIFLEGYPLGCMTRQ